MASGFLDRRVDRETLPLATGDVLVIVLLLYAVRHQTASLPPVADELGRMALVVAPFLIGWLVAAVPIGAYSPGAGESAKAAIPLAVRSWIVACVIGLGLRESSVFTGEFVLAFAAVVVVGGSVALGGYRWLVFRVFD